MIAVANSRGVVTGKASLLVVDSVKISRIKRVHPGQSQVPQMCAVLPAFRR